MRRFLNLAYGSNLHPARIGRRLPAARCIGVCELAGFSIRFNKRATDGSGKCNMIATQGESAWAAVYELTPEDARKLHDIEGPGYQAEELDVAGYGTAFYYAARPSHVDDDACPYPWYLDFVVWGARHHGFPADYVRMLAATSTVADTNTARERENSEILRDPRWPLRAG